VFVRDDVAIADLSSAQLSRQTIVSNLRDQASYGQVTLQPALIAGCLSPQHLESVFGAVFTSSAPRRA
jgi:hypothetical protein